MILEVFISIRSIDVRYYFSTNLDTVNKKKFILALGLTTIVAIYLESCVNLREYSFTFIPP